MKKHIVLFVTPTGFMALDNLKEKPVEKLQQALPESEIMVIPPEEKSFREKIAEIVHNYTIDLFVTDFMILWSDNDGDLATAPEEVRNQFNEPGRDATTNWRSGIRMAMILNNACAEAQEKPVPVIYYTYLDHESVSDDGVRVEQIAHARDYCRNPEHDLELVAKRALGLS